MDTSALVAWPCPWISGAKEKPPEALLFFARITVSCTRDLLALAWFYAGTDAAAMVYVRRSPSARSRVDFGLAGLLAGWYLRPPADFAVSLGQRGGELEWRLGIAVGTLGMGVRNNMDLLIFCRLVRCG